MTDEDKIEWIIHSFSQYNLRDIKEINNSSLDFTIAEFILCSCFIDQISGFRYNIKEVGKRYKQFVQEYMPDYNANELYKDLRNKLVHNYSTGNFYGLTRKSADLHLHTVNELKVLNLENLIKDLENALNRYIHELRSDRVIRGNALQWYKEFKILGKI